MRAQKDVLLVANNVDSSSDGDVATFDIFKLDWHEFTSFAVFFRFQNSPDSPEFWILEGF